MILCNRLNGLPNVNVGGGGGDNVREEERIKGVVG